MKGVTPAAVKRTTTSDKFSQKSCPRKTVCWARVSNNTRQERRRGAMPSRRTKDEKKLLEHCTVTACRLLSDRYCGSNPAVSAYGLPRACPRDGVGAGLGGEIAFSKGIRLFHKYLTMRMLTRDVRDAPVMSQKPTAPCERIRQSTERTNME